MYIIQVDVEMSRISLYFSNDSVRYCQVLPYLLETPLSRGKTFKNAFFTTSNSSDPTKKRGVLETEKVTTWHLVGLSRNSLILGSFVSNKDRISFVIWTVLKWTAMNVKLGQRADKNSRLLKVVLHVFLSHW